MQIQNHTAYRHSSNFKGSITISRINKDPNSEKIVSAIYEAVDSFIPEAEKYKVRLFKGMFVDPVTKAKKIIISTGDDDEYIDNDFFGLWHTERAAEKIEAIDMPLLAKIEEVKEALKTKHVEGACLIDFATYHYSGFTQIDNNYAIVGTATSGDRHWRMYKFIKQPDGTYLSNQRKTFGIYKAGVLSSDF